MRIEPSLVPGSLIHGEDDAVKVSQDLRVQSQCLPSDEPCF